MNDRKFDLKVPGTDAPPVHVGLDPAAFVRGAEAAGAGGTKSFPLRLVPALYAKVDYVWKHSTYKSKQEMVVDLLTRALDSVPLHDR